MKKPRKIRIVLAEQLAISRAGLCKLLNREPDIKVVAVASDEKQATNLARRLKPDVLLFDLALCTCLDQPNGAARRRVYAVGIPVVMVASESERNDFLKAFYVGARGLLLRERGAQFVPKAVRSAAKGMYWAVEREVPDLPTALRAFAEPGKSTSLPKPYGLTAREREVIGAIVLGCSNLEIAAKLKISESTVKHHVTHIFDKVGTYNRLELALFAMRHGLIGSEQ